MLPEKRIKKLRRAMDFSRRKLAAFREHRLEAIRQFVGTHYSEDGANVRVPVNLLELAIQIYTHALAASAPRVMVRSQHTALKRSAERLALATNHLIEDQIGLESTLQRALVEALFSIGIIKVGLNVSASVEIGGFQHDIGQPFADVVSLDDWVHDMNARTFEQVQFCGNRFRVALEDVKASGLYDKRALAALKATPKGTVDDLGEERAEDISMGSDPDPEEYREMVELWDIWLPAENLLVTLAADESVPPLRVVEWDGPETGPYHMLSFTPVPSNLMPLPPVALWMDLHDLANRLYRKLGNQADRQKTIVGYQRGEDDDADTINNTPDAGAVGLMNPAGAKEFRLGGVDPQSLGFLIDVFNRFSYLAGNLDALGGLSPMSDTVGQDQMLLSSASQRVNSMRNQMVKFTKKICRDLAWYLWTDPLIELPLTRRYSQYGIEVPIVYSAEDREGEFLDYNFDIEPYSMQRESPGTRLQVITTVFQNFLLPLAPMMEAQGIIPNIEGLLRTVANYTNMTELEELVMFTQPQQPPEGPTQPGPVRAPVTQRTNVRVNRPGATRAGRDNALQQLAMGGKAQPSQVASITRPLG